MTEERHRIVIHSRSYGKTEANRLVNNTHKLVAARAKVKEVYELLRRCEENPDPVKVIHAKELLEKLHTEMTPEFGVTDG